MEKLMRVQAHLEPWSRRVSILISSEGKDLYVAEPLVMRRLADGEMITEPTVKVDSSAAQELMDDLWRCGIRPSEGSGSAGALAATQRHLDDMRRLVFEEKA